MSVQTAKVSFNCGPGVGLTKNARVQLRHPKLAGAIYKIAETAHEDPMSVYVIKTSQQENGPSPSETVATFAFPRNCVVLEFEIPLEVNCDESHTFDLKAIMRAFAKHMGQDVSQVAELVFSVDGHAITDEDTFNEVSFAPCPPRPKGLPHKIYVSQASVKLKVLSVGGETASVSTKYCWPGSAADMKQALSTVSGDKPSKPVLLTNDRGEVFAPDARPFAAKDTPFIIKMHDLVIADDACAHVEELRTARLKLVDLSAADGKLDIPSLHALISKLPPIRKRPNTSVDPITSTKKDFEVISETVQDVERRDTWRHIPETILVDLEKLEALCAALLDADLPTNLATVYELTKAFVQKMSQKRRFARLLSNADFKSKIVGCHRDLELFSDEICNFQEEDEELKQLEQENGVAEERKQFVPVFEDRALEFNNCLRWMDGFRDQFRSGFEEASAAGMEAVERSCVEQRSLLDQQYAILKTITTQGDEAQRLYGTEKEMFNWAEKALTGLHTKIHAEKQTVEEQIRELQARLAKLEEEQQQVEKRQKENKAAEQACDQEYKAFQGAKNKAKNAVEKHIPLAKNGVLAAEHCRDSLARIISKVADELGVMDDVATTQIKAIGMDCCEAGGGASKWLAVQRLLEEGKRSDFAAEHERLTKEYLRIRQARRAHGDAAAYSQEELEDAKARKDAAKTQHDESEREAERFAAQRQSVRRKLCRVIRTVRKVQDAGTAAVVSKKEQKEEKEKEKEQEGDKEKEQEEDKPEENESDGDDDTDSEGESVFLEVTVAVSADNHQLWAGFGLNSAASRSFALPECDRWERTFETDYRRSRDLLQAAPLGAGRLFVSPT